MQIQKAGADLLELYRNSAYEVRTPGLLGSGLAIAPRVIATAAHVLETVQDPVEIEVVGKLGHFRAIDYEIFKPRDLAFIYLQHQLPMWISPSTKPWSKYSIGDDVIFWGSTAVDPTVRPWSVQIGYIYGPAPTNDADFLISAPIVRGCSGAGVVHLKSGKALGVIVYYSEAKRELTGVADLTKAAYSRDITTTYETSSPLQTAQIWMSSYGYLLVGGLALGYLLAKVL